MHLQEINTHPVPTVVGVSVPNKDLAAHDVTTTGRIACRAPYRAEVALMTLKNTSWARRFVNKFHNIVVITPRGPGWGRLPVPGVTMGGLHQRYGDHLGYRIDRIGD